MSNRLKKELENIEDREQTDFKKGFSTIDHIHTLNQILEKKAFNSPLCMTFVDYEKVFDALEKRAIIAVLKNQQIEKEYIDLIKYL